jgi:hypothetical protein
MKAFRRTKGIVTDDSSSDPMKEADVIMTAAVLGFAGSYIATSKNPIQFDMDPLDTTDQKKTTDFNTTVAKMDAAVAAYLTKEGIAPSPVHARVSPGYTEGAVIMGVYTLAGQKAPQSVSAPKLTEKGEALWKKIATVAPEIPQYTGRGAYTGFVDNPNTEGDLTSPVGPLSTVRMGAPAPASPARAEGPHPRWLPPKNEGSALWTPRQRKGADTYVPWGLIMGDKAGKDPASPNSTGASNLADQVTLQMRDKYGMVFVGDIGDDDIATYTHGMIQAIYKAYRRGPSCAPYEIAVGDETKKMASCPTCAFFMYATGYPPTSIHLGRGESWAPLYQPYNPTPNDPTGSDEPKVIRDLNNAWYASCSKWLATGMKILDDAHIAGSHKASRDAVRRYLSANGGDVTVGGVLILDAVTVHDAELDRIGRTLA